MCLFNARPIRIMKSTTCYKIVQHTVRGYRSYIMGTWIPDAVMNGTEPFVARGRKEVDGYRKEVYGGFIHSYAESSLIGVIDKMLSYDMLTKGKGIELWECRIEPTPGFGHCYVSDEKFPEYASDELWFVRPVVRTMDDLKSLVKAYGIKRKGFLGRLKEGLFLYIRIVIKRLKSCV